LHWSSTVTELNPRQALWLARGERLAQFLSALRSRIEALLRERPGRARTRLSQQPAR